MTEAMGSYYEIFSRCEKEQPSNFVLVSVQCVDNKDGQIVYEKFEILIGYNNITQQPNIQLSIQCVENQQGLHGQIVYEDVSHPIYLQPLLEPDNDDEGIVIQPLIIQQPDHVQLSIQCMENQQGFHGQIVYEDVSHPIYLQPLLEPDNDDEGIVIQLIIIQQPNHVQLSIQCMENQQGFHGQIVYEDVSKGIII